jgi:hypothetical protein
LELPGAEASIKKFILRRKIECTDMVLEDLAADAVDMVMVELAGVAASL